MAKIEVFNYHGFLDYYIDFKGNRYRFSNAHKRTTFWRCAENSKTLKVMIYPAWSFMDRYLGKEVRIKEI